MKLVLLVVAAALAVSGAHALNAQHLVASQTGLARGKRMPGGCEFTVTPTIIAPTPTPPPCCSSPTPCNLPPSCPEGHTCCYTPKNELFSCPHMGGTCCGSTGFCCPRDYECLLDDKGRHACQPWRPTKPKKEEEPRPKKHPKHKKKKKKHSCCDPCHPKCDDPCHHNGCPAKEQQQAPKEQQQQTPKEQQQQASSNSTSASASSSASSSAPESACRGPLCANLHHVGGQMAQVTPQVPAGEMQNGGGATEHVTVLHAAGGSGGAAPAAASGGAAVPAVVSEAGCGGASPCDGASNPNQIQLHIPVKISLAGNGDGAASEESGSESESSDDDEESEEAEEESENSGDDDDDDDDDDEDEGSSEDSSSSDDVPPAAAEAQPSEHVRGKVKINSNVEINVGRKMPADLTKRDTPAADDAAPAPAAPAADAAPRFVAKRSKPAASDSDSESDAASPLDDSSIANLENMGAQSGLDSLDEEVQDA